ncbi:hypothetical protein POJ06DRAFT_253442 [Lipomyces tetrasporus]|uniref:DUF155 domain-containing protein n=1 Tax=Lipomyces tetrasporus TaxID=54092 RepID=A0AAD7QST6_9ASCO|nr:uncharacterized protein POJ06DRAFT_253442 [Lipomyces tetrasporus]KAJ8100695.1 hypothetical protein POJ06DRAFT_253442 [Lipomyces tetrasporus]
MIRQLYNSGKILRLRPMIPATGILGCLPICTLYSRGEKFFTSGPTVKSESPEAPPTSRITRTTTKQSLRRVTPQRVYPIAGRKSLPFGQLATVQPCVALTVADSYDLPKALEILHNQGHLQASILLPHEVTYAQYPLSSGQKADAFVLSNGSIVTFGMTEIDTIRLADELRPAEIRPYQVRESEDMDYVEFPEEQYENSNVDEEHNRHHREEVRKRSFIDGETICIRGPDRVVDKAAFASGLARSTKLAVLEMGLEKYLESIRDITDRLATGAKLPVHDGREVLKKTGELLTLRGNLNLYSELTETPDLYWSEPELETIYRAISKNLDIAPRIAILNKKLDYVSEVVSILKAHLSEEQSVRLEWMIIILIMVEVAFETSHFVERYFDWSEKSSNKKQDGR